MTTADYKRLDRAKTVVILPTGILEEHGPHMPAYTDGYISDAIAQDVAEAVVAKGWHVVLFPRIPLGSGGANEIAGKYPFPGTFAVRLHTLRAIFMDLGDELAEAGFKHVFIANNHGGPNHNQMLDQACAYFAETHGGQMVVLRGVPTPRTESLARELDGMLSTQAKGEDAGSVHAGIQEQSLMLFLQPRSVPPTYREAPSQTVPIADMATLASKPEWPGYFGAPRFSTAAYGAVLYRQWSEQAVAQAFLALEGKIKTPSDYAQPPEGHSAKAAARDRDQERRQQAWLAKKQIK